MRVTLGAELWFIGDHNRWFQVKVTKTYGHARTYRRVQIQATRKFDAEGQVPWPYLDGLDFAEGSKLYKRLRPLTARPSHPVSPSAT